MAFFEYHTGFQAEKSISLVLHTNIDPENDECVQDHSAISRATVTITLTPRSVFNRAPVSNRSETPYELACAISAYAYKNERRA